MYAKSNHLEEYRNDYVITDINGVEDSVTFRNGIKLYAGDVAGSVNETQLRRIQIRETILSHIEKEQELFEKDIKVLSLFFIDEVAKYRRYNPDGKGEYAEIFEQEYTDIIKHLGSFVIQSAGIYRLPEIDCGIESSRRILLQR